MTCEPVDLPHVAPGWGCCVCKAKRGDGTYNSEARSVCKICGHERCDLAPMREDGLSDFIQMNPEAIAVLRPKDPALAVKAARKIAKKERLGTIHRAEANRRFQAMLKLQEYRFVGILEKKKSKKPRILDPRSGEPIDHLKMGDSFVPYKELALAHTEDPHDA
jgi:hypothetical protein